MQNKHHLLYIHWWNTFRNHDDYINCLKNRPISIEPKMRWTMNYLDDQLWDYCKIIRPRMPLKDNAVYEDWRIMFERHFEYLQDNVILIGESLWGIFLAKYLSENVFPKKILSVYMVCPPFDNTLPNDYLVWWFELKSDLSQIEKNCQNVNLMFSKDDDCIPVSHADKYREKMNNPNIIIYDSKNWHFNIEEFPEIADMIIKDIKSN